MENLLEDFEYEVQGPYLLYRNAAQEVNGIWFYNRRECEDIANLFSRYCRFLRSARIWNVTFKYLVLVVFIPSTF